MARAGSAVHWTKLLKTSPRGGRGLSKQEGATRHLTTHTAQPVETVAVAVLPSVLSSSPTTQSARHVFQRREDALPAIVNIKHKLDRLLRSPTRRPVACRIETSLAAGPVCCASAFTPTHPTLYLLLWTRHLALGHVAACCSTVMGAADHHVVDYDCRMSREFISRALSLT